VATTPNHLNLLQLNDKDKVIMPLLLRDIGHKDQMDRRIGIHILKGHRL
jgi:hypothetical protein